MGAIALAVRGLFGPFSSRDPATALWFGGGPTTSGATVSEWTALNYSAWWAATQIIANAVSSLPLQLFRRLPNDQGKEPFRRHPLYRILHDEFNPEMTSMVARKTMQGHVLGWGNAYAEIERDILGRPIALWPLTPDRVVPDRNDAGRIIYRVNSASTGRQRTVAAADILHIPGLGFDGLIGYSVIRKARETIGLGLATENFGAQFFGNGAVAGLVAMHPGSLTTTATANIKKSIQESVGGEKRHSVLVLEEGMKVEKTTIPPDDAQFLETRKFQDIEVCRWFNLPPHKLSEMDRATFSNIEHQAIEFVVDTIRPWLVTWEQELNRKLVAPLERGIQFAEHNVDGLLRGDTASRYAAYAVGRQWGWLSANDIRERENQNPVSGGDMYLVPTNMLPADRINEVIDHQVAPVAPPPSPGGSIVRNDPQSKGEIIASHRKLIIEAMGRETRREANSARRASKKGPDGFQRWRADFYSTHGRVLQERLLTPMEAIFASVTGTTGAQEATRKLAEDYVNESLADLDGLPEDEMENAVDLLVSRWELQRPPKLADTLMTEELRHALSDGAT
jgi:HK97 family phage portal protein